MRAFGNFSGSKIRKRGRVRGVWPSLVIFAAALGTGVQAQMQLDNGCMQDVAGFNLNCTANDVSVASVTDVQILDDGCAFVGDTVTFSADYEILLNAQARHDIGVYFATDGGDALTGSCTIVTLPEVTDLDSECKNGKCAEDGVTVCAPNSNPNATCEPIDLCGDIDPSPNPIILNDIVITALCIDPDGDNNLNLPNATSWRQPGSNDICTSPLDAYPGAPSKCRTDVGLDIPIFIPNDPCIVSYCENDNSIICGNNADCAAVGGSCIKTATPVDCSGFETDCATFACDPKGTEGNCDTVVPKPLSTVCEADGSLCTPDHCDGAGSCVANGPPVDCTGVMLDQCNNATCDPATGLCTVPDPKPLSTVCEADGSLCTPDHCDGSGSCVANGPPVDCTGVMPDQCNNASCDPNTGLCTVPDPKPLSTPCERNDGQGLCTEDHCDGNGNCVFLQDVVCDVNVSECEAGDRCNPANGQCEMLPDAPAGTACEEDGDLCTTEVCDGSGACIPDVNTPPVDCTGVELDACNNATCDPVSGLCTVPDPKPLSTVCEADGNLCTPDHCDGAGSCVPNPGSPPVDCTGVMLDQCNNATCDPVTGQCTVPDPKPLSTVCEADNSLCTPDHCDGAGNCVPNPGIPPVDCSCAVDCTACNPLTGTCEPSTSCNGSSCPDDGFSCTADLCEDGVCTHVPNHGVCGDGVFCTSDLCDPGHPQADPITGCVSVPDDLLCDDAVDCTNPDVCDPDHPEADGSGCVYTPVDSKCDDEDPCTDDACDAVGAGECVNDCQSPGITCPDDVIFECDNVGSFGDPVVDDDCSESPVVECVEDVTPGKLPQESNITRTCTVTNDCGNQTQCVQMIQIVDTTPPEITCPPDLEFECDAIGDFGEPIVTDNCDPDPDITIEVEQIFNDCSQSAVAGGVAPPPKILTTRTITAVDGTGSLAVATGGGPNEAVCVQTIAIFDTTPPIIPTCPGPIDICATDELAFAPPMCLDSCGDCTVTCIRSDGQPLNAPVELGPLTITCTAVDECDNESAPCTVPVNVMDCGIIIPAASEWGLVCLTLALMALAKVHFRMRRRPAAM